MNNKKQRLSNGELPHLRELVSLLKLSDFFNGDAVLNGADPVICSPHHLGEAAATAQLLIGIAAAAIWKERTGQDTDVSIDIIDALHYLHPTHYVWQSGYPINVGAEYVEVNDLFRCCDGRYVMLEAGPPYQKFLKGYLDFFDCGNNKQSIAREVAKYNSYELEEALAKIGLPCCRAFSRDEWLAHPQGKILNQLPVIEIEKISSGPPVPFDVNANLKSLLEMVRVLDFTHVLAGPRSVRTLAEFGANVLHISTPAFSDTLAQHLGVNIAKRYAYLDLRDEENLENMYKLASDADVFTTSYRHSVNEKFGLLPEQLVARSERGIVCMTVVHMVIQAHGRNDQGLTKTDK